VNVLSVRVADDQYDQVERQRLDMGLSRTEWMRWAVGLGLDNAPAAPAPDPVTTHFCLHPDGKVLNGFCVVCSTQLASPV
jgi:hypothetical protein